MVFTIISQYLSPASDYFGIPKIAHLTPPPYSDAPNTSHMT